MDIASESPRMAASRNLASPAPFSILPLARAETGYRLARHIGAELVWKLNAFSTSQRVAMLYSCRTIGLIEVDELQFA
ncbi:hypothetical protein [Aurantiacibacter suaedae]|uniref:hypothetical protein n=1 Tax=Aurantiacibacter suaedae TaxID=2545755 RepID=UPI0019D67955|nr:hypothetical protein [Aurantiacibacter suaedae]